MYDHVAGEVIAVHPAEVVVRAGGVGYSILVPMGVSTSVTKGEQTCLYTILHVTDGNPTLVGFRSSGDRAFARLLLSVSGVGPAMSLAIMSTFEIEQTAQAIMTSDHDVLKRVKGVGKKTAERICLELRDKVGKLQLDGVQAAPTVVLLPQSCEDAIAALTTLGFAEKDAQKRVRANYDKTPDATSEDLIKSVLRG